MRANSYRRAVRRLAVVMLSLASLEQPAQAQFGLAKRAVQRRVEQKADDKLGAGNLIDPTFDNTTLEITAERFDKWLAAAARREAEASKNRALQSAVQAQESAVSDSAQKAHNSRESEAYSRSTERFQTCRSEISVANNAEMERKSQAFVAQFQANPTALQNSAQGKAIMSIMQEVQAAAAKGDQAAMQRAQMKLEGLMGMTSPDSASIDRASAAKCGARPVRPASMVLEDRLHAKSDSLIKIVRSYDSGGGQMRGEAVGMSDVQAHMFWERLAAFSSGQRPDAPITRMFTKSEYDLLVSRRGDVHKALSSGS